MFEGILIFWWQYLLVAFAAYLFGSVNYSIVFSRLVKRDDVRKYGSGNAGTTNMFRVYGVCLALLTFLCDCIKGVVACLVARFIFAAFAPEEQILAAYLAGLFVVIGHIAPIYYKLHGGKGFATTVGICFALQPMLMLCLILPILLIIVLSDRMSVAALIFAISFSACHWIFVLDTVGVEACIFTSVITVLVFVTHRLNIVRLACKKEPTLGLRKRIFFKSDKNNTGDISK